LIACKIFNDSKCAWEFLVVGGQDFGRIWLLFAVLAWGCRSRAALLEEALLRLDGVPWGKIILAG